MTQMELATQCVLAKAWSLLNTDLWKARLEMEQYLTKHFDLKPGAGIEND